MAVDVLAPRRVDRYVQRAPGALGEPDVVVVAVGEDERTDVIQPAADALERAGQELPVARKAGVDDGDALVVGQQVPVDVGVADAEHAADYPYWIVRNTFAGRRRRSSAAAGRW